MYNYSDRMKDREKKLLSCYFIPGNCLQKKRDQRFFLILCNFHLLLISTRKRQEQQQHNNNNNNKPDPFPVNPMI